MHNRHAVGGAQCAVKAMVLDGNIDELASYQCSGAAGELSNMQTTLLTAIEEKFSTASKSCRNLVSIIYQF